MQTTPREADWKQAPGLLEGATKLQLTPEDCDLDYWFAAAPRGTLQGLVRGHSPEAQVPDYMLRPGPLREAIMNEAVEQRRRRGSSAMKRMRVGLAVNSSGSFKGMSK